MRLPGLLSDPISKATTPGCAELGGVGPDVSSVGLPVPQGGVSHSSFYLLLTNSTSLPGSFIILCAPHK